MKRVIQLFLVSLTLISISILTFAQSDRAAPRLRFSKPTATVEEKRAAVEFNAQAYKNFGKQQIVPTESVALPETSPEESGAELKALNAKGVQYLRNVANSARVAYAGLRPDNNPVAFTLPNPLKDGVWAVSPGGGVMVFYDLPESNGEGDGEFDLIAIVSGPNFSGTALSVQADGKIATGNYNRLSVASLDLKKNKVDLNTIRSFAPGVSDISSVLYIKNALHVGSFEFGTPLQQYRVEGKRYSGGLADDLVFGDANIANTVLDGDTLYGLGKFSGALFSVKLDSGGEVVPSTFRFITQINAGVSLAVDDKHEIFVVTAAYYRDEDGLFVPGNVFQVHQVPGGEPAVFSVTPGPLYIDYNGFNSATWKNGILFFQAPGQILGINRKGGELINSYSNYGLILGGLTVPVELKSTGAGGGAGQTEPTNRAVSTLREQKQAASGRRVN